MKKLTGNLKGFVLCCITYTLLQSCGSVPTNNAQPIKIDGSSTVYPITEATLKAYEQSNPKIPVKIDGSFSGTGGGFAKFCRGETDINGASRPILENEMKICDQNQVRYIELPIAFDALTVVVNNQNNWADSITLAELRKMWEPSAEGKITKWQQVNSSWPDKNLTLHGPGKDSGTFDYFTEAVMGQIGQSRGDYNYSEDDRALVNAVSQDTNALGYFGYAYYQQNKDKIKAVAVDNGKGAVFPSAETVKSGQYQPLTRPLFIYVNAQKAQENPALEEFVEFYLEKAPEIVDNVGYVSLSEEGYHLAKVHFQRFKVGTVFEGRSAFNLTIEELLRKQAKF